MAVIEKWCDENRYKISSKQILHAVTKSFAYTEAELKTGSTKEPVQVRCCVIWFCKQLTRLSNTRVGELIGRSMATTTYHHSKANDLIKAKDEMMIRSLWNVFYNLKQLHNERVQS